MSNSLNKTILGWSSATPDSFLLCSYNIFSLQTSCMFLGFLATLFDLRHIINNYISCIGWVLERPYCVVFSSTTIRNQKAFLVVYREAVHCF